MTSSASWIKNNMMGMQSKSPKRVMSEAEMRVQKALQKLEIPEWYLNKHSKAPKILKNDTPIDYRQPSWKQGTSKQVIQKARHTEEIADPTRIYSRETRTTPKSKIELAYPSINNANTHQITIENQKNILSPKCKKTIQDPITLENVKPIDISEYNMQLSSTSSSSSVSSSTKDNDDCEKSQKTKLGNKSNSFPKISPSRKVQNINIVLEPTSPLTNKTAGNKILKKNQQNIDINSNMNSEINRMTENFDSTFNLNDSDGYNKTPTNDKSNQSSYFNSSLVNVITPKPFCKKIGTPFMTPVNNFKIPQLSTPDTGKKPAFYTSTLERPSPLKPTPWTNQEQTFGLDMSIPSTCNTTATSYMSTKARNGNAPGEVKKDFLNSTYWVGEMKPVGMDPNKPCEECGSKLPRFYAVVTKKKNLINNLINERKSIIEYKEQQLKKMQRQVPEEIEMGSVSGSGTGSRSGSGRVSGSISGSVTGSGSGSTTESVSDIESNSAASLSSISLSYKGSEIGTAKVPATSTLKSNIRSPFRKQSTTPKKTTTTTTTSTNNTKNGVQWIPVKQEYIDRASRFLSMTEQEIRGQQRRSSIQKLEKTTNCARKSLGEKNLEAFEAQQMVAMKKFLQLEECAIIESGYSSRSLKTDSLFDSLASSRTWFEDSVSDETESDYSFSLKGRRAMKKY
ncbi:uncharacterized protein DDB_G0280205-like [Leptopilina heterotoma]|uniref:uncharacterized protein DDB_G0280205-like n=1 Tax=Leptopilina heterotoma TaxID=63436 RepID=UPI001CA9A12D|nr:uncharacterized protein DDB_G0280205-like [Leptopilina heterotoma]